VGVTATLRSRTLATLTSLSFAAVGLSCSSNDTDTVATIAVPVTTLAPVVDLPDVVVTYSVLATVVLELVAGVADVVTIIPDGQDAHDFEPSAKDIEAINNASYVVANGLNFEEGLEESLEKLHDGGGPVFFVSDHITVREMADDQGDDHGADDPHLWLNPGTMLEMLPALASELATALNADLSDALTTLTADLTALDAELAGIMSAVEKCELVTGHDELGYFTDRYGCETIGAVIPSSTTTSEASAGELAELKEVIAEHGAKVLFTGLGTPQAVAEQISKETGVVIVELSTHVLGTSTSYAEFMRLVANQLADALK